MQQAFVLHQRPYGESSQLVEMFAREAGRVGVMARGARRPRSPWRGLLQPFAPLLVEWRGRGELETLVNAEPAAPSQRVPGARIPAGWYVNELMLRLFQRADSHAAVFDSYAAVMQALPAPVPLEPMLRQFEVFLLAELGYAPELCYEAGADREVQPGRRYRFVRDEGPLPEGEQLRDSGDARPREAVFPVMGETLLALAGQHAFPPSLHREAKHFTRFLLEPHLGDRQLRTRALLLEGPRA